MDRVDRHEKDTENEGERTKNTYMHVWTLKYQRVILKARKTRLKRHQAAKKNQGGTN